MMKKMIYLTVLLGTNLAHADFICTDIKKGEQMECPPSTTEQQRIAKTETTENKGADSEPKQVISDQKTTRCIEVYQMPNSSEEGQKTPLTETEKESVAAEQSENTEEKSAAEQPKNAEENSVTEQPKSAEENPAAEQPKNTEEKSSPAEPATAEIPTIAERISAGKEEVEKKQALQKEALNSELVKQVNQVSDRLLQQRVKEKNPMVSGAGIALLLEAIADGAADASKTQITHWLTTVDNKPPVSVVPLLKDQDQYLSQAAAMLMPKPDAILPSYQEALQKDGFIVAKDLADLNKQVAKATQGKIPEALKSIDGDVRLVLTHALGFSAPWKKSFDPQKTQPQTFHSLTNDQEKELQTLMMSQTVNAVKVEDEQNIALALPFAEDYVLLMAMPKDKLSEKTLLGAQDFLKNQHDALLMEDEQKIELTLPKWKLEEKNNLIPLLEKEGITDIFSSEKASLPEISKKDRLFVQQFKQDILINIHEEGGEAAAATTAVLVARSISFAPPTPVVNFDRAFAYAIVQKKTGLDVISGFLNEPEPVSKK